MRFCLGNLRKIVLGVEKERLVPGAEAPDLGGFWMSGLKSRPISEAKANTRTGNSKSGVLAG